MIGGRLKFKNAKPSAAAGKLSKHTPLLGKRTRDEVNPRDVYDDVVDSGPKLQKPPQAAEEVKETEDQADYIE